MEVKSDVLTITKLSDYKLVVQGELHQISHDFIGLRIA